MSSESAAVRVQQDGPVMTLTMNRPKALNAFDVPTIEGLAAGFTEAAAAEDVRVVVVTGSGRAFCAGGDLRAIQELTGGTLEQNLAGLADKFHAAVRAIRSMPKPVVAAINGVAAGGGLSLALACDLRVMTASGFLQQAYTSNGLCIDGGGTWTLPRLVGMAKALELAMLDPRVPSDEALRLGLVSQVYPDAEFSDRVGELVAKLATKPVGALALAKRLLSSSFETELDARLDQERDGIAAQAAAPEGREGIQAFLEKRRPNFV